VGRDVVIFFLLSHSHFVEVFDGLAFTQINVVFGISNTGVDHFCESVLSESEWEHVSSKSLLGIDDVIIVDGRVIIEGDCEFSESFSEIVNLEVSGEGVEGGFFSGPWFEVFGGDVNQSQMDFGVVVN